MTSKFLRLTAVLAALAPAVAMAGGQERPMWEIGAGVAAFSFPAYRGSENQHNFLMPIPYFTYHGDFLKADRHGIRGDLFDSDRVDLTLSFSASPPTSSEDAPIRDGMPDLEPTFEIGPQIDVTLWRSENRARFVKLRMPVRAAITVEGSPRSVGWIFSPDLNMDIDDLPGMPGWSLGLVAGPYIATRRQHEFFYSVPDAYATPDRPAYSAKGGYSGAMFLVALSKRFAKTRVGFFARYDTLSNAAFEASPLVKKKHMVAGGISIAWVLDESKRRVWVDD